MKFQFIIPINAHDEDINDNDSCVFRKDSSDNDIVLDRNSDSIIGKNKNRNKNTSSHS